MRSLALLAASLGLVAAAPSPQKQPSADAVPAGMFLEKQVLQENIKAPGGKIVKLRYGPYNVKAMSMLSNNVALSVKLPCTNCYVTALEAGLENQSGQIINVETGQWLHHMVIYQTGANKGDLACPLAGIYPQRIFASGNERTPIRMNSEKQFGLRMDDGDNFTLLYDLVNDGKQDIPFYITMTYEVSSDPSIKPARVAWTDITGSCGISYAFPKTGAYQLTNTWTSNINGYLLSATGHVHDGGTKVTLEQNGRNICTSDQVYGRRDGYIEGNTSMKPGMAHISDTGTCADFGEIKNGDKIKITAYYDTNSHPLNTGMGGTPTEIMGISLIYIGPK